MGSGSLLSTLVGAIGATAFVLALAWVVLRLVRALPSFSSAGDEIDVLQFKRATPVGQRERVTLLEFRDEVFMVGVAPGGVSLLARFPADRRPKPEEPAEVADTNNVVALEEREMPLG